MEALWDARMDSASMHCQSSAGAALCESQMLGLIKADWWLSSGDYPKLSPQEDA